MPSDVQTATIGPASNLVPLHRAHEALTWMVLVCVYGAWAGLTYYAVVLPWWALMAAGGYIVCLHGSLQHEAVHGHFTGNRRWNTALMMWPLSLWVPFTRYRTLHTAHHGCPTLTDPVEDTESFYWTPEQWRNAGTLRRAISVVNQTLAGRLLLGPLLVVPAFWVSEARLIAAGDRQAAGEWLVHLMGVGVVLGWVTGVCGLPAWQYLVLFAWPATSLTLLRSFTEHRPGPSEEHRTALVEGSFATRLLFLNNNLHLVHHQHPELPWYAIRKLYRARRSEWLDRNGGFHYKSYWHVVRRYLLRPKDHPVHPGCGFRRG